VIAHIGGLPVEEVLPALVSGAGTWFILRLTSLGARLPRLGERARTQRETDQRSFEERRRS
jgi:hypothetical protein